jgi:mRNA-degrading endonuclease RelE of RelBE toxin-antitoxin system
MNFLIADSFTASLARLSGNEQKAVKTTVFDLQVDPSRPGLSFHRLDRAKDSNFWSVRVSSDIRIIVHRTSDSLLLCYVGHHDDAYDWAERRKLETHPRTGAAQIVEIRETVQEIVVPIYVQEEEPLPPGPPLLDGHSEDELLGYGVPPEWVDDVRAADEDTLLALVERLPAEAAEAVLELATGGTPRVAVPTSEDPFEHPDAQRRFRILENVEELERALAYPWDRWMVFLHPDQRQWVEHDFNGPARVSGSAGTGKTIVALHRAVHLARKHPDARILLATFTGTLANALRAQLRRLVGNEPRIMERIEIEALDDLALRIHRRLLGPVELASSDDVSEAFREAGAYAEDMPLGPRFVRDEWAQIVDAWQVRNLETYLDISRVGRRTRLASSHREALWPVFERVHSILNERGLKTLSDVFSALAEAFAAGEAHAPYDFAIVDEAQDLSVAQLRFFAAMGGDRDNALFFAGDLGQRIFQAPFSWKALGVDVRGRSRMLHINYRTSHQIRTHADRLLGPEVSDIDGNREDRTDTVSLFNGPSPTIELHGDEEAEIHAVAEWLSARAEEGAAPETIGVFVRSEAELSRAKNAIERAGLSVGLLDEKVSVPAGHVSVGSMHLAKGLEFGVVAVMACDDEVIPLQERIEAIGGEADLQEIYDTERHLLYVACTRARDHLLVTAVEPGSEFLEDLQA